MLLYVPADIDFRLFLLAGDCKCVNVGFWAPTLVSTLNLSSRARRPAKSSLRNRRSPLLLAINACFYKFYLCDADLIGYTTRHLHQRISEHKYSAVSRHIEEHGLTKSALEDRQVQRRFTIQRKSTINCKKVFLKRNVFSLFLKADTEDLFLISNGRAFHSVSLNV